jgi:23S rRNA (uridine2552-2'-O)-methyltransferase
VTAKNPRADSVECAGPYGPGRRADLALESADELPRCLVGERNGEDLRGSEPTLGDQSRYAMHQHSGLPASGPGQDQQRSVGEIDRFLLPRVQCHHAASDAAGCGRGGQGRDFVSGYQRKDPVYRAAQQAGYRSRAAVKLQDLDSRFHLLRPGMRVAELGCWPGGWLQVASERVGPAGYVVGIDLLAVEPLNLANVSTLVGDVQDPSARERFRRELGPSADLLLSDMAPKLTGVRVTDQQRQLLLVEMAADVACEVVRPGGRAVIKLLSGAQGEAVTLLSRRFARVRTYRPPATRRGSSESYALVMLGS